MDGETVVAQADDVRRRVRKSFLDENDIRGFSRGTQRIEVFADLSHGGVGIGVGQIHAQRPGQSFDVVGEHGNIGKRPARGRTLESSGTGSDHGWGGHQLVLGGPDAANSRGVLIPTTSLDQYGATFAKWFGVGDGTMPQVFPHIAKFSSADLGFLTS